MSTRPFTRPRRPIFSAALALMLLMISALAPSKHIPAISDSEKALVEQTIALIKEGGPFPYPDKDGRIFHNREGKLPRRARGYYHEYTVPTPHLSHRGARRIVTGGNPPEIYYYTRDHYHSFMIWEKTP